MKDTSSQYDSIIKICSDIFDKKMKDYGAAWRILRTQSITDQVYIKVKRIRNIEETGENKVGDNVQIEYMSIVNYSIMALVQLEKGVSEDISLLVSEAKKFYKHYVETAKKLMMDKNHDYDEAWREMRISSLTDMIFQKVLRIKQIEENKGKTLISEGIDANYYDIINYAIFALIRLEEIKTDR